MAIRQYQVGARSRGAAQRGERGDGAERYRDQRIIAGTGG